MKRPVKLRSLNHGPRQRIAYRPFLELLEDRLPPGEAGLGSLAAGSLLAPGTTGPPASFASETRLILGGLSSIRRELSSPQPTEQASETQATKSGTSPSPEFTMGNSSTLVASLTSSLDGADVNGWNLAADPLQALDPFADGGRARPSRQSGGPATAEGSAFSGTRTDVATPLAAEGGAAAGSAFAQGMVPVLGTSGFLSTRDPNLQLANLPARFLVSSADPANLATADAGFDTPAQASSSSGVRALFNLDVQTEAPFPTNVFTVPDRTQNTGRHVNLPFPDCKIFVSNCEDIGVLNTLDGFNMQPRLSVPFDGSIDVHSVTSQTVFLISLGDTLDHHDHGGQVVGINQIVWDPETSTLHAKSDEILDQHTRYALIVTNGLRGEDGSPVEASEAFRKFRHEVHGEYKQALLDAVRAARRLGVRERDIVTASVFSTQSATAVLEKIRDQIHAATPEPVNFLLGPGGARTVFPLDQVKDITFNQQTGDDPPAFTPIPVDLPLLRIIPGAVSQVAFGKFRSPDYEAHPGEYIPPVGTRTGTPAVQRVNELYFNLVIPSGPKPAGGWPVAIFGHAGGRSKDLDTPSLATTMAAHGVATIFINAVGFGFGPLGTLTVNQDSGESSTFLSGGRGFDQNGDHIIRAGEGQNALAPRAIIAHRDSRQQTVVDFMQLVREIEVGVDVNGSGSRDLDPSRIYYFGISNGGIEGAFFLAVEPDVHAGALDDGGGGFAEYARISPGNRAGVGAVSLARTPPVTNYPGVTSIGGVSVGAPYFNENLPPRDGVPLSVRLEDGTSQEIRSPVINTVPGADALQEVFEHIEWVSQAANSVAYAPHLKKSPLAGVPVKSILVQFARGDQTLPNPFETALLRAGDLADRATLYRHDLAYAEDPTRPKNPHGFMGRVFEPELMDVALGAQSQIATFFASDGKTIIHPEPARFFETPIKGPLPEDLNYIP